MMVLPKEHWKAAINVMVKHIIVTYTSRLEERSGDDWSKEDSSSGTHESLVRYFHLDQRLMQYYHMLPAAGIPLLNLCDLAFN